MIDFPYLIKDVLNKSLNASISREVESQQRILTVVRECIPAEKALECLHCVPSRDRLIIYTVSQSSAFQLKYYSFLILKNVEQVLGIKFHDCQVRILYTGETYQNHPPAVAISRDIAKSIKDCAAESSSIEVRASLLRLVDTLSNRKPEN